jgi:hypothetical protein
MNAATSATTIVPKHAYWGQFGLSDDFLAVFGAEGGMLMRWWEGRGSSESEEDEEAEEDLERTERVSQA